MPMEIIQSHVCQCGDVFMLRVKAGYALKHPVRTIIAMDSHEFDITKHEFGCPRKKNNVIQTESVT